MLKFSEIEQLITYHGDGFAVNLSGIKHQLETWQNDSGLDLNPDFQRGHVWSEKQQTKFIEFILRGGKCPPILFNSPTYTREKSSWCDLGEEIVCVDGKQRLTAILKFLGGEVKIFGENTIDDFDPKEAKVMMRRVYVTFAVNQLQRRKELLQWYLELNEGHIAHTEEELNRVRSLIMID